MTPTEQYLKARRRVRLGARQVHPQARSGFRARSPDLQGLDRRAEELLRQRGQPLMRIKTLLTSGDLRLRLAGG